MAAVLSAGGREGGGGGGGGEGVTAETSGGFNLGLVKIHLIKSETWRAHIHTSTYLRTCCKAIYTYDYVRTSKLMSTHVGVLYMCRETLQRPQVAEIPNVY